jgi:4-amino-4-deoxy-L-arabinose transferase-like glycosyltransferase
MSKKQTACLLGALVSALTLFRLWFAAQLELAPDEAYYWRWSLTPNLGTLDHPPLVAWLIHLGTRLLGPTALGVRVVFVLLSSLGVVFVYLAGRQIGLERKMALSAAAIGAILPIVATGSVIATPDTPLGLAWVVSLFALLRLTVCRSTGAWFLFGAAFGIGLLAKHTALLIPLIALATAIGVPRIRADLRSATPWLALGLGVLIALPFLVTEALNGLPSVSFQLAHLSGEREATGDRWYPVVVLTRIAGLVGGEIGLLTPLVAGWAVFSYVKVRNNHFNRVLALGYLTPLAAAILAAFGTHPQQNWAALGQPAALLSGFLAMAWTFPDRARLKRSWSVAIALTVIAATGMIHAHTWRPFLPLPPPQDPISRLHGWKKLTKIANWSGQADAVVGDSYGLAAEAAWQQRDRADFTTPILSTDRRPAPPPGRWLLLSVQGTSPSFRCKERTPLKNLPLIRTDGETWRVIAVELGSGCAGPTSWQ